MLRGRLTFFKPQNFQSALFARRSQTEEIVQAFPISQTQVRNAKLKKSYRRLQPPEFPSIWDPENICSTRPLKVGRARPFQLPYKTLIICKDSNLGFEGERILIRTRMGWKFVNQEKAVWETPETIEKYVSNKSDTYWKEVAHKRHILDQIYLIHRSPVTINRRIAGPEGHYFWPITRQDICNQLWSTHKVAIRPEDIVGWPGTSEPLWKKPGLYRLIVQVGHKKVMLRLYALKSSKSWDGYTHEVKMLS